MTHSPPLEATPTRLGLEYNYYDVTNLNLVILCGEWPVWA